MKRKIKQILIGAYMRGLAPAFVVRAGFRFFNLHNK